jgi:intracellular sulfur oxidation DsrE/DsrF family protein
VSASAQLPGYLQDKISYPVFDQSMWSGVIKTDYTALKYSSKIDYKVAIDVYEGIKDSTRINSAVSEIARTYNLLIANGTPEKNLEVAVVIHGGAVDAFFTNEAYMKTFGIENPNLPLIEAMHEQGIKFYVCSQSLGFKNYPPGLMAAPVEIALSAKTALITLDQMGYSYLNVNED